MKTVINSEMFNGKPYAGNPHVWFDEGEYTLAAMSRCGSLLYKVGVFVKFLIAFSICIVVLLPLQCLHAAEEKSGWQGGPSEEWFVEWDKALECAKKTNKNIFVLNTGSDWCYWCKKLRSDVLDTSVFRDYAQKNLVLLYLDSPYRNPLGKEQKKHNRQIVKALQFGGGVPCAVIVTPNGKKLGMVGGGGDTADKYIERMAKQISNNGKTLRDENSKILFKEGYARLAKKIAEERAKLPPVTTSDFKAVLTGVAVVDMRIAHKDMKNVSFLPPETKLEIPFGKKALFRVKYDFPTGYGARIWTRCNERNFASNPSVVYKGCGVAYGFLSLLERGETSTIRSISIRTNADPELDDYESGWMIDEFMVSLKFLGKDEMSHDVTQDKEVKRYVSKGKLHSLYRSQDRTHVFVEVCHQHHADTFRTLPYTIDRLREAIADKTDILFMTLAETKDGVLFSAQSGNLEKISNGKGCAGDYSAKEFKKLRIKKGGGLTTKRFALFEDMLRIGKGKILFKVVGSLDCMESLAALLDKYDAWESVIVEVWSAHMVKNCFNSKFQEKMMSGELLVTACGDKCDEISEVLPECTVTDRGKELKDINYDKSKQRMFCAFVYGPGVAGRTDDVRGWEKALGEDVTVFRTNRAKMLKKLLKKRKRQNLK